MPVPVISEQEFEQDVLMSELPVLVEFMSPMSPSSKATGPEAEAAATELEGKARIVRVDVEKSRRLVAALRLQGVPTFAVFVRGRPVAIKPEPLKRKGMVEMIEPFLPRAEGAISPAELAQGIREQMFVPVDIRDKGSFGRAHIPSAVSFPLDEIRGRLAELHMLSAHIVLYCRTGKESKDLAMEIAEDFEAIGYLEGGFLAWEAEQFPVERAD